MNNVVLCSGVSVFVNGGWGCDWRDSEATKDIRIFRIYDVSMIFLYDIVLQGVSWHDVHLNILCMSEHEQLLKSMSKSVSTRGYFVSKY